MSQSPHAEDVPATSPNAETTQADEQPRHAQTQDQPSPIQDRDDQAQAQAQTQAQDHTAEVDTAFEEQPVASSKPVKTGPVAASDRAQPTARDGFSFKDEESLNGEDGAQAEV